MGEEVETLAVDGIEIDVFDDVITITISGQRVSLGPQAAEKCARRIFNACHPAWEFVARQHPYYGRVLHLSLLPTASVGAAADFARCFQEENNQQVRSGGVRSWRDCIGRAIDNGLSGRVETVSRSKEAACILDYLRSTPNHTIQALWEDGTSAL